MVRFCVPAVYIEDLARHVDNLAAKTNGSHQFFWDLARVTSCCEVSIFNLFVCSWEFLHFLIFYLKFLRSRVEMEMITDISAVNSNDLSFTLGYLDQKKAVL